MRTVAALYIDPGGPYPSMPGVDAWDAKRDARLYDGPHPVVAHPPCGPWGRLRHLYSGGEWACAALALAQVRRWGGVLEHPAGSMLWAEPSVYRLGFRVPDVFGGYTVEVDQVAWGHPARKRTWLYVVGVDRKLVMRGLRRGGTPTHWCSGSRTAKRGAVPEGIKVCSVRQRRRTPQAFAEWLVSLARASRSASWADEVQP